MESNQALDNLVEYFIENIDEINLFAENNFQTVVDIYQSGETDLSTHKIFAIKIFAPIFCEYNNLNFNGINLNSFFVAAKVNENKYKSKIQKISVSTWSKLCDLLCNRIISLDLTDGMSETTFFDLWFGDCYVVMEEPDYVWE